MHSRNNRTVAWIAAIGVLCLAGRIGADSLALKTGKSYTGTIRRADDGKITVTTAQGDFSFPEDSVAWSQTTFTEPPEARPAFQLLQEQNFTNALPMFQRLEQRHRDLPVVWYERALYGLGLSLANTRGAQDSLPWFQKLLQMFPQTRYKTAATYWVIEARVSDQPSPQLRQDLESLLVDPRTSGRIRARAHMGLARFYEADTNISAALEHYATVVVLHGDQEDLQQTAQRKCADFFLALGRTNEAAFYFRQLVELYPGSDDARVAQQALSHLNPAPATGPTAPSSSGSTPTGE
jgi:tetratricopeptide (TPR) repeat protein